MDLRPISYIKLILYVFFVLNSLINGFKIEFITNSILELVYIFLFI